MSCSNCFNGCTDITSDQCVKYTGPDISELEISNGDPLSTIISKLSTYLQSALDGTGITLDISETCDLVSSFLEGTTLPDFISALIQSACSLQEQVTANSSAISTLNANYTLGCVTGVSAGDGTHAVVQAIISKLCDLDVDITALGSTVNATYVKLADLNSLIAQYLSAQSSYNLMNSRMVPYSATPFFAPDSYMSGKFDSTGAGIGSWAKIYLCNGRNGTPDLRGRVPVGAINGMNGGTLNSAVDPATSGNPNYSLNDIRGENNVKLTNVTQIPSHTHLASVNVTDPTHTHFVSSSTTTGTDATLTSTNYIKQKVGGIEGYNYYLKGATAVASVGKTNAVATGISVEVTNEHSGGTSGHNNIQPVIACYYIMYIP